MSLAPAAGFVFLRLFLATAAGLAALLFVLLALIDPYGVSPVGLPGPRPIMDINQRYMYPQVVRSRTYDSAVFGTSTLRLLDPQKLDATFGGRFANLAMNAATPWEQLQLAGLFQRESARPKTVLFGLDSTWCEEDADAPGKRVTFRAFPHSFYDDNRFNDFGHFFNLKSLEIAGRLAAYHVGRAEARIRADGYENFLPPDSEWTQDYANRLLWQGPPRAITPVEPPVVLPTKALQALRFPAIDWLADHARSWPADTRLIIVLPPNHISGQPVPGSYGAAIDAACRSRLVERLGGRARVIDLRFWNDLTRNDANYWDPMHFRLPLADRVLGLIAEASTASGTEGRDWRRLAP